MKDTLKQATDHCKKKRIKIDTGQLLISMVSFEDTASNLLRLKGLVKSKLKTALPDLSDEPPVCMQRAVEKAKQIARSFRIENPSTLHLLAALCSIPDSNAQKAMGKLGLDICAIRTQALRCMTRATVEREKRSAANMTPAMHKQAGAFSIPLGKINLKSNLKARSSENSRQKARPRKPYEKLKIQSPDVGMELEKKQKRTKYAQERHVRKIKNQVAGQSTAQTGKKIVSKKQAQIDKKLSSVKKISSPLKNKKNQDVFELTKEEFPILCNFGRDLTQDARMGKLDKIIGRRLEINRISDVLNKRRANCPCLTGPPGSGKTAVVEGFAAMVAGNEISGFGNSRILEVSQSDLLSGTSVRGALAERLNDLSKEIIKADGNVILFFDEFHSFISSNDGMEAIQALKASIGKGELPIIAATTTKEYAKYVEKDPTLARRFTAIEIKEPTEEESIEIVEGLIGTYEKHHGIKYTREAVNASVRMTSRYIADRALPDKAISIIDLTGSMAKRSDVKKVTGFHIASALAQHLCVPVERLVDDGDARLMDLEKNLGKSIIGHKNILMALGETLRRNSAGFKSGRPIGSFLFLGPTGVGKTHTAKSLGELLFPGTDTMIRLDMSEFAEAHCVAKMIGAPPGYIGHEDGGQLTEAVRKKPYSLILLDEVEKAHLDVLKILLQVLEDGRLTDGRGNTVDFENTIIIMTSNLGVSAQKINRRVGFAAKNDSPQNDSPQNDQISLRVLNAAKNALPIELWNRIDEPCVFESLKREEIYKIAELMLENISNNLTKQRDILIKVNEKVIEFLIDNGGYDKELGARPMRRTIQKFIESPIAKMILAKEVTSGQVVELNRNNGEISFSV